MKRARLATVMLTAGLGLMSGCNGFGHFRLLKNRGACCTDGVPIDAGMSTPGPGLGDFAAPPPPMPPYGAAPNLLPAPNPATTGAVPGQPPPRLVPQPDARPMPYTP